MENTGFLNNRMMRICNGRFFNGTVCLLLLAAFCLSGCSTATTFRVLDAETREPIDGAVALATWGGSRRMAIIAGPTFGYTAKAVEEVSDKDGYLTIPGTTGEKALNPPLLQIYKPGYVGWNSQRIYLGHYNGYEGARKHVRTKKRENFVWKDQDIYLEPWNDDAGYNHYTHWDFMSPPTGFEEGFAEEKHDDSIYYKARDYERLPGVQEKNQWRMEKR